MGFKDIFKVFFKNYVLVLKVLLAQVIMLLIGVGVLALSVSGVVSDLGAQLRDSGLSAATNDILDLLSNSFSANEMMRLIGVLVQSFHEWGLTVDFFYYKLSLYTILFFLWLLVVRFLMGVGSLPLNDNLNEYLSSSYSPPFYWQYFKAFGSSCKQQLISLITEFLADIAMFFAAVGVYVIVFVYSGIWGLVLTLLICSALMSYRRAATAFWLPELASSQDRKIRPALRKSIQNVTQVFGRVYLKTFIVFSVTLAMVVAVLLMFGLNYITLLAVMFIFAHNNIFQTYVCMVEYYKFSGKPFYVTRAPKVNK